MTNKMYSKPVVDGLLGLYSFSNSEFSLFKTPLIGHG